MSRRQKLILAILALADLLVILGLGAVVLRSGATDLDRGIPEPDATPMSVCAQTVLDALARTGAEATVAWPEPGEAMPAVVKVHYRPDALPPDLSPQLVWLVVDSLPPTLLETCTVPSTVTLLVEAIAPDGTRRYAVEINGEALTAWLQNDLDDEALAAQSRYRGW
ncbi:MAG: hypothetical protein ACP5HS_10805 [Anaerolineae bacterium]